MKVEVEKKQETRSVKTARKQELTFVRPLIGNQASLSGAHSENARLDTQMNDVHYKVKPADLRRVDDSREALDAKHAQIRNTRENRDSQQRQAILT